jgi:uncharacterized lipoprotein YmbA
MTRTWLHALVWPGCCLLAACGSSPPTRFYILSEIAPPAPATAAAARAATPSLIPVRLQPLALAPELDRPELVTRNGPNRVQVADFDRWAAPLVDQIRQVLSDDLAARLPPGWVADPNEPATSDARRLLTVAIDEFYGDAHCAVSLRASWSLTNPPAAVQQGSEQVQLPASATCTDELPAAMSRAIGVLADRLAAVLVGD